MTMWSIWLRVRVVDDRRRRIDAPRCTWKVTRAGCVAVAARRSSACRSGRAQCLQRDQQVDVAAACRRPSTQLVHADAVDPHHRQAREPRAGLGLEQAQRRLAQPIRAAPARRRRRRSRRARSGCAPTGRRRRRRPARLVAAATTNQRLTTSAGAAAAGALGALARARPGRDAAGRSASCAARLVAPRRPDLEAVQDHLLQPRRAVGAQRARRHVGSR